MANSESRDRPETEAGKPQIEVTDEMVDAGAKALLRHSFIGNIHLTQFIIHFQFFI